MHNPMNANVGLSRDEMAEVGKILAEGMNQAIGPAAVMIPLRGWSIYGAEGGPLHQPGGYRVFIRALKKHLREGFPLTEVDAHINDRFFVDRCMEMLLRFMMAS